MRSRYSAYVLGLPSYVLATWHPGTRQAPLEPDPPGLKWLGLEMRRHATPHTTHTTIEFVTRSKLGGRAHCLHEVGRFVLEGGRWFYVNGDLR